jgi:hypothetical protein
LLPPGAATGSVSLGRQVALPSEHPEAPAVGPKTGDGALLLPTEQGGFVALREPTRTGPDGEELQQRSPAERSRRKLRKNLVLAALCLVLMAVATAILLSTGPPRW